ncbi:MAG: hypothetical protein ACLVD7_07530 [[Clostridium] leptum]
MFSGLLFTKRGGVFPNESALVPPRSAGGSLAGIVKIAVKSPLRSMLAAKVFLPGASFGCAIGFPIQKIPQREASLWGIFNTAVNTLEPKQPLRRRFPFTGCGASGAKAGKRGAF